MSGAVSRDEAAGPQREQRRSRRATAGRILSHPLLLLSLGALISTLIVPSLTQRWQDHQRALDVQTALVADISEASETFLQRLFIVKYRARALREPLAPSFSDKSPSQQEREFVAALSAADTAMEKWNVRAAVIGARLRAYYPRTSLQRDWQQLMAKFEGVEIAGRSLRRAYHDPDTRSRVNNWLTSVMHKEIKIEKRDGYARVLYQLRANRNTIVAQILDITPKT
jgi:hypothetical protein